MSTIESTAVTSGSSAVISPTGGSSETFVAMGIVDGKQTIYFDGDGDFNSRRTITFSKTDPKPNASSPGGYTQERRLVVIKRPKTLDNGDVTIETLRMEMSTASETTDSEKLDLQFTGAQVLGHADFVDYWAAGKLT
jgi:hypothetical protein